MQIDVLKAMLWFILIHVHEKFINLYSLDVN